MGSDAHKRLLDNLPDGTVPPELGEAIEEFRPGIENAIAAFIMGAVLIIVSIAGLFALANQIIDASGKLPFYAERGPAWLWIVLLTILALLGIAGGVFLLWLGKLLWSIAGVWICSGGICFVRSGKVDVVLREQVAHIEEHVSQKRFPLKYGLDQVAPMGKARSYEIELVTGRKFGVDGNSVRQIGRFGKLLEEWAKQQNVPWKILELNT